VCDSRGSKHQGRRKHGDEEERLLHSSSPWCAAPQSLRACTAVSRR
jgi:hypothetical protein